MQITRQTEYAIRILLELAEAPEGSLVPARAIAERQGIPEGFLMKTVQLLARAGLVVTQRGMQGGVRMVQPPEKITIADVLTIVEGPIALNICLNPGYSCPNMPTCGVRETLARAQEALIEELNKKTLADLARRKEVTG